jgi:hypothetical protein
MSGSWYPLAVSGPFDTRTRYLVQAYPADWLAFLGFDATGTVEVVDANLTAVSAEVDKVLRVRVAGTGRLVHLEFQSSYDPTIGARMMRYNAMLHEERRFPLASVLVLLRPAANGPATSGTYQVALPDDEEPYFSFHAAGLAGAFTRSSGWAAWHVAPCTIGSYQTDRAAGPGPSYGPALHT